jgi:hypothetical protein
MSPKLSDPGRLLESFKHSIGDMSTETSPSPPDAAFGELMETDNGTKKSWRFYLIIVTLGIIAFASALEGSIIAIALPEITHELSAADNYVWIASSYLVAQTVIQPLCAQLSNILGRRNLMIFSIAVFALGSGIAGGATDVPFLIAGRTVQGYEDSRADQGCEQR